MFRRKPEPVAPTTSLIPIYEAEIGRLQQRLAELVAETEILARLRFIEWKVRKAEERKAWLTHGVSFPQSDHDREQDAIFSAMEHRMKREQEEALGRIEAQERKERKLIESQGREKRWLEESVEGKAQDALAAERRHELEVQRIEAQKAVATTIAQALQEDLS